MGWFSKLVSGGGDPIESISKGLDGLFTSDEERMQAKKDLEELRQKPHLMQALANVTSANHRSMFVAGARPFLLWVCGVGLAMAFIANPLIEFFSDGEELINVPLEQMMELTIAMLGLATLRTVEKLNGVSK